MTLRVGDASGLYRGDRFDILCAEGADGDWWFDIAHPFARPPAKGPEPKEASE